MDTIFCLVGPSGSGKTTVAKALEKQGYNVIQSYTTRPRRSEDEWGHTYVTAIYNDKPPWVMENVIAYNEFAGNHYWATKEQYKGKGKSVYIIDPPGDKQLREEVDCEVVTIFLATPRNVAWERMIIDNRGACDADERIKHDAEVFAAVKTDWVVDTDRGIKEVIADIGRIIDTY